MAPIPSRREVILRNSAIRTRRRPDTGATGSRPIRRLRAIRQRRFSRSPLGHIGKPRLPIMTVVATPVRRGRRADRRSPRCGRRCSVSPSGSEKIDENLRRRSAAECDRDGNRMTASPHVDRPEIPSSVMRADDQAGQVVAAMVRAPADTGRACIAMNSTPPRADPPWCAASPPAAAR